ncbi:ATP-binding protein [Nocardia sp. NPDC051030]|uniref:sensor histidine kinase n=1 Tax=Nocardia sp. NPDC051030 TaxID=3155162 RepID=UPI003428F1AA
MDGPQTGQGTEAELSAGFSGLFTARIPDLIDRYRARLAELGSPLVSDPGVWAECSLQAQRIFDCCARSIIVGKTVVTPIDETFEVGGNRVRQGMHIAHSIRAGGILWDLGLSVLADCAVKSGAPQQDLIVAVRALQQGIAMRLEFGSEGYDAFLLKRVREAHEQSNRQLARDIHDHIGNSVSLALRQLELFEIETERDGGDPANPHVQQAKDAILETVSRSRDLVSDLRRAEVAGSLEVALRGFAASLEPSAAQLDVTVCGDQEVIPVDVVEELFVMTRECLRNVYAHAGAATVAVRMDFDPHRVRVEIIDDGKGFDVAAVRAAGHGNGLFILTERSDLVGGTVDIDSAPGRGTHVSITIPVARRV